MVPTIQSIQKDLKDLKEFKKEARDSNKKRFKEIVELRETLEKMRNYYEYSVQGLRDSLDTHSKELNKQNITLEKFMDKFNDYRIREQKEIIGKMAESQRTIRNWGLGIGGSVVTAAIVATAAFFINN